MYFVLRRNLNAARPIFKSNPCPQHGKKGIALNVFLAASKFAAGILGHSAALVSDAVDSASDIFSNLIVMAGIKISHKASDMEHQYGHERMECVASIIMSALLALAGAGIGFAGIQKYCTFPPKANWPRRTA